ncbi:MAG TPA: hypothetical protein VLT62_14725 [Candidatus Methylomirabilis sp.]|nr:hypothetical protein [Candidatus Methylomirabilis sp.]
MIFPKGQVVYEHLNTSFTRLDAMLEELKADNFTGYVQLNAPEYLGLVLLNGGSIASAMEEGGGQRRNGGGAIEGILAKGRERDGLVSVFRVSPEMAHLLSHASRSQVVYKDLTSDLTSLDRLISSLQGRRHSGCIEVQLSKGRETATIFLLEGKVLEITWYHQGTASAGPTVLDQLIRVAAAEGALFTVYSVDTTQREPETSAPQGHVRQEQVSLWQEVLKAAEGSVDPLARTGTFLTTFKRTCIDLADAYPFLDPFAAEFEYRDGQIRYDGEASAVAFNQGLSRCLAQCLRTLAGQPATKEVLGRMASMANALKKRHGGRLAEIGLGEVLPEVFGS